MLIVDESDCGASVGLALPCMRLDVRFLGGSSSSTVSAKTGVSSFDGFLASVFFAEVVETGACFAVVVFAFFRVSVDGSSDP